jgi:thioredoxin-like negative regulator of GroEL
MSAKKPAFITTIITVVILIAAALPALAQDWRGQGRVTGTVTASDGTPIVGCQVKATHQQYQDGPTVETDDKGKWTISGIRGGTWLIDFFHPDYEPYGLSVEISNVRRGKPIDVVLEPAKGVIGGVDEALAEELKAAEDLYNAGNYQQALEAFTALQDKAPDAKAIKLRTGECEMMLGNYDKAKEIGEQVLTTEPNNAAALTLMGNIAYKQNNWPDADKYYARIVELAPNDAGVWANYGEITMNMRQYDKAQMAYEKAIELNPNYFDLYIQLSAVQMVAEEYDKALATLEKLKQLAPPNHQIFQVWNVDELIAVCKAELGK